MEEDVSALIDGELNASAADHCLRNLCSKDELRQSWVLYQLIGDHLRGEARNIGNLSSRVAARLAKEPVVACDSGAGRGQSPGNSALYAAAAMLGAAVVWAALTASLPVVAMDMQRAVAPRGAERLPGRQQGPRVPGAEEARAARSPLAAG